MKFSEFRQRFPGKMAKIKKFVSGEDIKDILGTEAVNHFKSSFQNEGFTDEVLNPWKDVQRRNPSSPWYGHSGQTAVSNSSKILI